METLVDFVKKIDEMITHGPKAEWQQLETLKIGAGLVHYGVFRR